MASRSRAGRCVPAFLLAMALLAGQDWLYHPASAAAQDTTESDSTGVLGRLGARENPQPIASARVQIVGTHTTTTTDSAGRVGVVGRPPRAGGSGNRAPRHPA